MAGKYLFVIGWHWNTVQNLLYERKCSFALPVEVGRCSCKVMVLQERLIVVLADAQGRLSAQLVDLAGNTGSARRESVSGEEAEERK